MLRRFETAYLAVLAGQGNERTWPARAERVFRELGLRDVRTTVFQTRWTGGGPGCRLLSAAAGQLRAPLMRTGLSGEQLERADRLLRDPRVVVSGHALYSTTGRLPVPTPGEVRRPEE